jgi:hypothetical protein
MVFEQTSYATKVLFAPSLPVQKVPIQILEQLDLLAKTWNITRLFKERLPNLYQKEFVFLFDDSGSMRNTDNGSTDSRWKELKYLASILCSLATAFDHSGVDCYFLNRPPIKNVISISQLDPIFQREPTDYDLSPLSSKVELIIKENQSKFANGNLILLILTDGEPKSIDNKDSVETFRNLLAQRNVLANLSSINQIPISIIACTNDRSSVSYLDLLDSDPSVGIDVSMNYHYEYSQIVATLGPKFEFTMGDHAVKCLLGASDPWMDKIDEPKTFTAAEIEFQKYGVLPSASQHGANPPYIEQMPPYPNQPYIEQTPQNMQQGSQYSNQLYQQMPQNLQQGNQPHQHWNLLSQQIPQIVQYSSQYPNQPHQQWNSLIQQTPQSMQDGSQYPNQPHQQKPQNMQQGPQYPNQPYQQMPQNMQQGSQYPNQPYQQMPQNMQQGSQYPNQPYQQMPQNMQQGPRYPNQPYQQMPQNMQQGSQYPNQPYQQMPQNMQQGSQYPNQPYQQMPQNMPQGAQYPKQQYSDSRASQFQYPQTYNHPSTNSYPK